MLQDVDQKTGEDLNLAQTKRLRSGGDVGTVAEIRNPDRPSIPSFVPEAPDLEQVLYGYNKLFILHGTTL